MFLKMQKASIVGKIYNVIKAMYWSSNSRIKCRNLISSPIEITMGFTKELLFNVFINDIRENLLNTNIPSLHDTNISHLLYADDLLLLLTCENGLPTNIKRLNELGDK